MQELFKEFKPNTAAEWKTQLIKDLKGESYESLVWHNENGIDIQPFYTSEDLKQSYEPAFTHAQWEVCVKAGSKNAKEINTTFLKQLNAGATAISLDCRDVDLSIALEGIQLNYIQSTFFVDDKAAADLKIYLEKNYEAGTVHCSVFPLALESGADLEKWLQQSSPLAELKNLRTVTVNALPFHNRSCLAYYEIALILSQLKEYLEIFVSKKENPGSADFVVKTGVSTDYFIQIAKLRAVRRLWNILRQEYNIQNDLYLVVETSLTNKSISDSYNNLLRTTVESMAAVSGGCNELLVTEFDVLFPTNKILAERMAVNQQLILKEESYFDKMADIACGSFYIENITDALATRALESLKRFEKEGGYFVCLEKGLFTREINEQAKLRDELVSSQKQISIGVNKFKNEKENILLTETQLAELKKSDLHNPVLNFELQNFFNLKNA